MAKQKIDILAQFEQKVRENPKANISTNPLDFKLPTKPTTQTKVNLPTKKKSTLGKDLLKAYENFGTNLINGGLYFGNMVTGALKNNANSMAEVFDKYPVKDRRGNVINPYKVQENSLLNKADNALSNLTQNNEKRIQENADSITDPIAKKASELSQPLGQMIPGIGLSLINPAAATGYFVGSSGGQYRQDALNKGASEKQAQLYGGLLGTAEGLSEMLGIGQFAKGTKAIAKEGFKSGAKALGISVADNAMQEAIMEPTQEIVSQGVLGKSDWKDMPQRMIKAGFDGATVSLLLAGAGAGYSKSLNIAKKIEEGKKVTPLEVEEAKAEVQTNKATATPQNTNTDTLPVKTNTNIPTKETALNPIYDYIKLPTMQLPNGEVIGKKTNKVLNNESLDNSVPSMQPQNANVEVRTEQPTTNIPMNENNVKTENRTPATTIIKDNLTMEDVNMINLMFNKGNYNKDVVRNLDDMAGGNKQLRDYLYEKVEKPLLDGKRAYAESVTTGLNSYKEQMDQLGIKKGSKESSAVQWLGEKQRQTKEGAIEPYDLTKLKEEFPKSWDKIVEAEKVNRKIYDEFIGKINNSLETVYPLLPNKPTEYQKQNQRLQPREDYYHHFNEMEQGFGGLMNILNTPNDIATPLVNKSEFTKPKSRFAGFLQKRKGGMYTADAVGGMVKYIPTAEYKVNIDPVIANTREFIKKVSTVTENTQSNNRTIDYLTDFTNDLAGKTNPLFDRSIQKVIGRKGMSLVNWLNSRVKSNAILGNLNSTVAQFFNLPNATAYIKNPVDWLNGLKTSVIDMTSKNEIINQSAFLKERYMKSSIDQFDDSILKAPQKFAEYLLEFGDKKVAQATWYSAYNQFERKQGNVKGARTYENAVDYADDITRRVVAGRGIGELPITQKSKFIQLIAPFQVEINNSYQLMKEKIGQKDAIGIANIEVATYLMNGVALALLGNTIAGFDFIRLLQSTTDELKNEEEKRTNNKQEPMTIGEKLSLIAGRTSGEVLSSIPYGNLVGTVATKGNDTLAKEIYGDRDPTRFGLGNIGLDAITTPINQYLSGQNVDYIGALGNIALPFGGKQVSRSVKGAQDIGLLPRVNINNKGVEYKEPINGSYSQSGLYRFPIADTPQNKATALTLGSMATKEGKEYTANNKLPMSDKQTSLIESQAKLKVPTIETVKFFEEMKKIDNDESLKGIAGAKTQKKAQYIMSNFKPKEQEALFENILDKEQNEKIAEEIKYTNLSKLQLQQYHTTIDNIKGEKDVNGSSSARKALAILNLNIPTSQKNAMFSLMADSNGGKYPVTVDELNKVEHSEKALTEYFSLDRKDMFIQVRFSREDVQDIADLGINQDTFTAFYKGIKDIKPDPDSKGKAIDGSKKAKIMTYINDNLNGLSVPQKAILLAKSGYADKRYAQAIAEYIASQNISPERKQEIWDSLGFNK